MIGVMDSVNELTEVVGQNRMELLLFKLSGLRQRYGINVFKVREVLPCPRLTVMPKLQKYVIGVAHIRGQTISVIDLAYAIGGRPSRDIDKCFIIIAEYNRSTHAFLVSSVERILNMNWDKIMPPPKGAGDSNYMTAVTEIDGEIKKSNVVRIKCTRKNNPYTVNVPVTVNVARATTIASANIPKGTTITADLLEDSFVNESTNTSAVITDKSMILGSKARRDIRAGEQIKVSDFCVIAKGDIVTIVASTNNLEIKTQGQALEEGKVNDLIQVKNVKTKKVIQAVVTGPNTVKVIF
jgi:flagella basal body P-ring formation protein FlgA